MELDDAFVGGRHQGEKRRCGTEGKRLILVVLEHQDDHQAGFIAMEAVDTVDSTMVSRFRKCLRNNLLIRTVGWRIYDILAL